MTKLKQAIVLNVKLHSVLVYLFMDNSQVEFC